MRILTNNSRALRGVPLALGMMVEEFELGHITLLEFTADPDRYELAVLVFSPETVGGLEIASRLRCNGFTGQVIGLYEGRVSVCEEAQTQFIRDGGLYLLPYRVSVELLRACLCTAQRLAAASKQLADQTTLSWSHEGTTFLMQTDRRMFVLNGREVKLRPTVWRLMQFFLSRPGRVLTREQIITACFKSEDVDQRTVDTNVKVLRKALGAAAAGYIKTEKSVGYKLSA